jgi:DNA-binding CsgD family transcriptional regulator
LTLTVRTQTKRAYAKLGVSTREELFARLLPFLAFGAA